MSDVHLRNRPSTRPPARRVSTQAEMKAAQCAKVLELKVELEKAGIMSVSEQARILGVSRSTAWAIFKRTHKSGGITASVIRTMLTSPRLPPNVRTILLEYVDQKLSGAYGLSPTALRAFRRKFVQPE